MKTHVIPLLLLICVLSMLTGCASGPRSSASAPVVNQISGKIHGGQQPVIGATIRLYTVGIGGDATPSSQLLTSSVVSDGNGFFSITGDYTCTNATQVYLTATGGNPGLTAPNPNLLLMAALGPCSALTASSFISVNELTTVAAAYALAPYATSATSIGSGTTDAAALARAFTLANEYVDSSTGQAAGSNIPSGYTVPTALLNTLADILTPCINSTGGVANDNATLCGALFGLTPSASGTMPTDTFTAALNLAKNPGTQTASLFSLVAANSPFQPTLPVAPSDFNVHILGPNGVPSLAFQPVVLPFADEAVNGPLGDNVPTIIDEIAPNITISAFNIIGPAASDFGFAYLPCAAPYTLGGTSGSMQRACTFNLSVKPSALGERLAYLQVVSDAPDSPHYLKLYTAGTAVATTPSFFYLSFGGLLDTFALSPTSMSDYGRMVSGYGSGNDYYVGLRFDYVGNLYTFSQTNSGAFSINKYDSTGGSPELKHNFNPTPPAGYSFNGGGTTFSAARTFAVDNVGQTYIPVQTADATPLKGIAVYPPNSTGVTAPSFVLTGYGDNVIVDPSGDLLTLSANGDIAEYQYGVISSSVPFSGMSLSAYLGNGPNARVIDMATDGAGDVYALIYGGNGYEVVAYANPAPGNPSLLKTCFGALSQMNQPSALAVDAKGDIYVSDIDPVTQAPIILYYDINGSRQNKAPDSIFKVAAAGNVPGGIAVR